MKLLGFFVFMFALGLTFIIGFVWGAWEASKRLIDHLLKKGYTIIPPKEDTTT